MHHYKFTNPLATGSSDFSKPGASISGVQMVHLSLNFAKPFIANGIAVLAVTLRDPQTGYPLDITYNDATALAFWNALNANSAVERAIFPRLIADQKLPTGTLSSTADSPGKTLIHRFTKPVTHGLTPKVLTETYMRSLAFDLDPELRSKGQACLSVCLHLVEAISYFVEPEFWDTLDSAFSIEKAVFAKLIADEKLPSGTLEVGIPVPTPATWSLAYPGQNHPFSERWRFMGSLEREFESAVLEKARLVSLCS